MNKKFLIIAVVVMGFLGLLIWLFIESTKPLPGVKLLQDGRDHLAERTKIDYKFNPPTSGNHYASWIKKGFYDEPRADGNLVHSLEHGYVIIWYNCERKVTSDVILIPSSSMKNEGEGSVANATNVYAAELTATQSAAVTHQSVQMTSGSEGSASAKHSGE